MLNHLISFSVFGALFMASSYFIAFFLARKGKTSPLYFGLFTLMICVKILVANYDAFNVYLPAIQIKTIINLQNFALSISLVFLTLYFKMIYSKFIDRVAIPVFIAIFILASIITFFISFQYLQFYADLLKIAFLVLIFYMVNCTYKALLAGKKGSSIFFIALVMLFFAVTNDFLLSQGFINTTELFPVFVFIFVLFQAIFISIKNQQITKENKVLSKELDYHNRNLEKIIEEKTSDIEDMKLEINDHQEFLQDLKYQLEERKEDLQAQSEMLDLVNKALDEERKKSETLLLNILPEKIATELKAHGEAKPNFCPEASVLFTDFVSFSKIAASMTPEELIKELHFYFTNFDEIVEKYKADKIKTIGDAYLCATGIMGKPGNQAAACVMVGLEVCIFMQKVISERKELKQTLFEIRIGVHTGPVVAGIVGKTKFAFDIWGDTVNQAKRIEDACTPGQLYISGVTYEKVKNYFICDSRGQIQVKHKGSIHAYSVKRLSPEFCIDNEGYVPNDKFFEIIGVAKKND